VNRDSQEYHERRFAVYEACYAYGADYNDGKDSRSYSLIGKVMRKGFRASLSVRECGGAGLDDPEARALYARLRDRNY
jgi:hypothetical protein